MSWTNELWKKADGEVIVVDGKTLRGSSDKTPAKHWITTVNAWAYDSNLVFAQCKVDDHSNEIPAIPALSELLDV